MQQASTPVDLTALLQDYLQDMRATPATAVPPHITIRSIAPLRHHRLQIVYQADLSNDTSMLLVMPPPPMARLLRSEKNMIKSEAAVVRWIREEASRKPRALRRTGARLGSASPEETEAPVDGTASTCPITRATDHPTVHTSSHLLQYLPLPVQRYLPAPSPSSMTPSSMLDFNVITPPPGIPISMLPTPLTAEERDLVDYEAGKLVHQLSRLSSRSGHFGPALSVLAPERSGVYGQASGTAAGMISWSIAFHSLLESILRDGEDMAVALAYSTIRKQFRRLGYLLDAVRIPSLVIVDAVDDTNLLVQRLPPVASDEGKEELQRTASGQGNSPTRLSGQGGQQKCPPSCTARGSMSPSSAQLGSRFEPGPSARIAVTGLRDWSHCVFGDPLFATVFHKEPSEPFLHGFGCEKKDVAMANPEHVPENRNVRLLLYRCYHAVVQIVKGFYRQDDNHTARELAARKQLTETLSLLEAISDNAVPKNGHRRPTGEISLAKKLRSDSDEDVSAR